MTKVDEAPPQDLSVLLERAETARQRGDWLASIAHWRRIVSTFPDTPGAAAKILTCLRESGNFTDAEQEAVAAMRRAPKDVHVLAEAGWIAFARQDWGTAAQRWQAFKTLSPDEPRGYLGVAVALRAAGHLDEAEAAIAEAAQRFPSDFQVQLEYCHVANARQDWDAAAQRWSRLAAAFPEQPDALSGLLRIKRETGRLDEAEADFARGHETLRADPDVLTQAAWIAMARADWTSAHARWSQLQADDPKDPTATLGVVRALRESERFDEAEIAAATAIARFPNDANILTEGAWTALKRDDWHVSIERWRRLQVMLPGDARGYLGVGATLRLAGRRSEAMAAFADALKRFPDNDQIRAEAALAAQASEVRTEDARANRKPSVDRKALVKIAWEAVARADWPSALKYWTLLLTDAPENPLASLGVVRALREAGRLDEAEIAASRAIVRFPDDGNIVTEAAWAALQRGDWQKAVERWKRVESLLPRDPRGYLGLGAALRLAKRHDEAKTALTDALRRFPDNMQIAREAAYAANDSLDFEAAKALWRTSLEAWPKDPSLHKGFINTLQRAQESDAARTALGKATALFPEDASFMEQAAAIEETRQNWQGALAFFDRARTRLPDDAGTLAHHSRLLRLSGRQDDAQGILQAGRERFERAPEYRLEASKCELSRRLGDRIRAFESLGTGCEFGMVQRECGYEPLGLMRWASIDFDGILRALAEEFEEIGDEAKTTFQARAGEYWATNVRYGFVTHTHSPVAGTDVSALARSFCRRQRFLKDKFLEDLRVGEKIFVFRHARDVDGRDLTEDEMSHLFGVLAQFGDNTLLHVRLHDAAHPPGTLKAISDKLMVGAVARSMRHQGEDDMDSGSWASVCEAAHELWSSNRQRRAAAERDAGDARDRARLL